MKTILVLFGGCSTEYEVSLHSAYAVLSHMDPARYTPLAVGITREGQWLCYTGDLSRLEDGTWQQAADCIPCTPLVEREAHALLLLDGSGRRRDRRAGVGCRRMRLTGRLRRGLVRTPAFHTNTAYFPLLLRTRNISPYHKFLLPLP